MKSDKILTNNKKKYHHGDLKAALVAAGIEILENEGLSGLSLRAIAARVGVSHTAPKNHFGSLKGLLTAIGTEGFRRHATSMRKGLSKASSREERLHAALRGYASFAQSHPALFQMMFSPLYCDFKDETLLAEARQSYAVLEEISTDLEWDKGAEPRGQLRTEMMLWSMAHGYAMLRISDQFRDTFDGGQEIPIEDVMPAFRYSAKS
jgi:AcrR family transcriptional regulator